MTVPRNAAESAGEGAERRGCRRPTAITVLSIGGLVVGGAAGNPGVGLLIGFALGMFLTSSDGTPAERPVQTDSRITVFIEKALLQGVIDRTTAGRLLDFLRRGMKPAPGPSAATHVAEPPPAATTTVAPPSPPARQPEIRPPAAPQPAPPPAARTSPRPRPRVPTYEPRPQPPSRLAVGLRRFGSSAGAMWKAFSADVAIHTVTYLGVLLLALVMFAFYGLGFYGEVISGERWRPWRPVVAAALPLTGFGVAALLRARTGIVFTANAIGFLAALATPIAMSSLFQDGAPWGPPDLDGPERWIGYAVVGIVSAGIFAFASRRSTMYAYLVGPGIWTAAGALGLYLEDGLRLLGDSGVSSFAQFTSDGISWAQMAFVLVVMAVTIPFTRLARGGPVAPRIVWSTLVCLPVVAIFGGAFAALQGSGPGLDPDAAPTVLLLATGAVVLSARTASFAWDDSGERLRAWLGRALVATGLAVVAAGWIATAWLGVDVSWIGAGLAAYAAFVLVTGERAHGGGRFTVGGLRLVGAIGMGMSLIDPLACVVVWGAAGVSAAIADASGGWMTRWSRVYPPPSTTLEHSALIAALFGAAAVGVGRLSWSDATGWILLAVSLALAATRFAPRPADAVRGLSVWAIPFVAAGVAVAAYRWQEISSIDTPQFGLHLLAAGVIVATVAIDWEIRLPMVVGAAVPGAALAIRSFDVLGSVIDASVLGTAGVALLGLSVLVGGRPGREADILGHVAVWLAPMLGSPSDTGLLIGLFALAVTHLVVAGIVDRGWWRSPGFGLAARESVLLHVFVGVVTLPAVAILASREFAWFAAERPRAAFVLIGTALLYTGFGLLFRLAPARRMVSIASYVLALASVGVAVPSSTALLVTTWSSAALFGWVAVRDSRPMGSLSAWVMALAGSVIASARLGVSRADLHEPLFAAGVGLIAIGAVVYRFQPRLRAWSVAPLGLGLLVMPAGLAFIIADQVHVVAFAAVAAGVYTVLIWLIRTGAFAPLAAAMVAILYAAALPESVSAFDHPLMWVPLGAAILAVAAAQPQRSRDHWLALVAPGLNVTWVAVLALAGAVSLDTGGLDRILLAGAVLVSLAALRWRSMAVAYASLALVASAGAVGGTGWLALALTFDAFVVGAHATARADELARWVLAPTASALGVGAIVSLGIWQQWSLRSSLIATAIVGLATAALTITFTVRRPAGRLSIWVAPIAVVAQGALVTYAAIGWDALGEPGRYGPLAAAMAAESALVAATAVTWRRIDLAWAAAAFAAGAYTALGGWRAWSTSDALVASAVPALLLGGVALGIGFLAEENRARLWEGPAHGLAQAAALGFLGVGLGDASIDPAAILTGFLSFQAVTAGVVGTRLAAREPVWAATGLGLASIVAAGEWANLDVWPAVWLAVSVGVVLAGFASVTARAAEGSRPRLWAEPALAASQLAWVSAPLLGLQDLSPEAVSAVAALVLAIDALLAASLVEILPSLRPRLASVTMASVAALLAVGAAGPDIASGLVILVATVGALMLIAGSYRDSGLGAWGEAVLVGGWVLTVGVVVLTGVRVEADTILGAVLVIGGAGIIPASIVSGRWRAIYLGMAEWAIAVPFLVGVGREITDANLVIAPVAVVVLVVVSIERLRARLLDQPFSDDMRDAVLYVEIVAMALPMLVAAWPAFERPSLGHLGLLAVEATALVLWALFTRVRRRLLWGVVGLIAVIVYPVARVLVTALRGGVSGGTMLAIGAVVALILIVIGSLLERSRTRVGDIVRRLGDALEGWS